MSLPRLLRLAALAALASGAWSPVSSQDLEQLVDESEAEETELRRTSGANVLDTGPESFTGRIRLPAGEDVQKLRISQDREIDAATYIVGPGDALQLYVWGEFDQTIRVNVNPEGHALVPTIGAFYVSQRTLAEVRDEIIAAAHRDKYPGVSIDVTLESMRLFTVYLTGAVLTEGSHTVSPITRVSDLIGMSGGFLDELQGTVEETVAGKKVTKAQQLTPQPTARRSIEIQHLDGSVGTADLAMFLATGDVTLNPYLRMGDIVRVEYRTHTIHAYGGVNEPGAQEYRRGDTVADLLRLAGGISGSSPLEGVEIWRFIDSADSATVIPLLSDRIMPNDDRMDAIGAFPLQPEDMLFLRQRSDWQKTPTVHIHGEVMYRGRYRIREGETRISDLITKAGGVTPNASLSDARLVRAKFRTLEDPELVRLKAVQEVGGLADMSPEERAYLKTKGREQRGRVVVDLVRLLVEGDESQDILLEGGDVIFIPEARRTVSLSGQLHNPGLIRYEEGRPAKWYIQEAGGYAYSAHKRGARVIRARSGQREDLQPDLAINPGDEIWVPEKQYRDWWGFVQGTVRTTAEALTLVILIRTL